MKTGLIVGLICVLSAFGVVACDVDPCPGKLTCKNKVCCPYGFPYECGGRCYEQASSCGGSAIECKPHGSYTDDELETLDEVEDPATVAQCPLWQSR